MKIGASFYTEEDEAVTNIQYEKKRSIIDKLLGFYKEKTIYTIKIEMSFY
jgi:hypothetical protein